MFKAITFAASLLATSVATQASPGFGPGNGGDVVVCTPSSKNPFNGMYTLDYLMTYNAFNNNQDITQVQSIEQSLARVRSFVSSLMPDRLHSFDNFISHLDNHTDYSRQRIWVAVPSSSLINIEDEALVRQIPSNCNRNMGPLEAIQAVIRVPGPIIRYEVDLDILRQLQQNPLQYSFLLVHEWLRDFTQDSDSIRHLNRYIHSNAWENKNLKENLEVLSKIAAPHYGEQGPTFIIRLFFAIIGNNDADLMDLINRGYLAFASTEESRKISDLNWNGPGRVTQTITENGKLIFDSEKMKLTAEANLWVASFGNAPITPLAFAILQKNEPAIELLIEHSIPAVNKTDNRSILAALALGRTDLAERLKRKGFINIFTGDAPVSKEFLNLNIAFMDNVEVMNKVCSYEYVRCDRKEIALLSALSFQSTNILKELRSELPDFSSLRSAEFTYNDYHSLRSIKYRNEERETSIYWTSANQYASESCGKRCNKRIQLFRGDTVLLHFIHTLDVKTLEILKKVGLLNMNISVPVNVIEITWRAIGKDEVKSYPTKISLRAYALGIHKEMHSLHGRSTNPETKKRLQDFKQIFL